MKQRADLTVIDDQRDLGGEASYSDYQETLKDFTNQFIVYYDDNLNKIFTATVTNIQQDQNGSGTTTVYTVTNPSGKRVIRSFMVSL